jgi:hypothetical protein
MKGAASEHGLDGYVEDRYILCNITKRWPRMDIESQSLTTCEVAPDGNTVVLGFTDSRGAPARIRLPLNQLGALAMTLPDLINKALQSRYGDHTLRYAYPLASWTVEQSSEPGTGMMTLSTTDGFSVCFAMERKMQHTLAEALASESTGEPSAVMN